MTLVRRVGLMGVRVHHIQPHLLAAQSTSSVRPQLARARKCAGGGDMRGRSCSRAVR